AGRAEVAADIGRERLAGLLRATGALAGAREVHAHQERHHRLGARPHDPELIDDAGDGARGERAPREAEHADAIALAKIVDQELVALPDAFVDAARHGQAHDAAAERLDLVPQADRRKVVGGPDPRIVVHDLGVVLDQQAHELHDVGVVTVAPDVAGTVAADDQIAGVHRRCLSPANPRPAGYLNGSSLIPRDLANDFMAHGGDLLRGHAREDTLPGRG